MCIGETEMMVNVAYALHHCIRTLLVTYSSLKSGNYREALNLDAPSTITINSLYHFFISIELSWGIWDKINHGSPRPNLTFLKIYAGFFLKSYDASLERSLAL